MGRGRVERWPAYLFKRVPEEMRAWLSEQASDRNVSVADVVRSALCERYRLRCPPRSSHYDARRDSGSQTVLLRLQPSLFRALADEAKESGRPMRDVIVEALESHHEGGS